MSGSMIIWNENTIKLIYEVQYITPMVILSIFGIRSIGCYRTFKGSDPNDDSDELCSNGNAPRMIEGNSNNMITRVAYALGHKTFGEGLSR
ncbi:MAG: hypothetical protein QOK68_05235 [Nitrososphaeraceae archaeon]|nr:hypothetical protein [Nitrososphaeraceae archaeon]